MKVALVDDDAVLAQTMYALVARELATLGDTAHTIDTFPSGEAFLQTWQAGAYDLIILDIYMGAMNGVEVAFAIRQQDTDVRIAFCTSSNEFAAESFEVGAKYYLRKPVDAASVAKMFQRLHLQELENDRVVTLPDGFRVKLRHILYSEYADHAVTLHLKSDRPHRLRTSHTEIESLLLPYGFFFSPYKGIVVNLHEVCGIADNHFVMTDNAQLPIVRRKQKEAKQVLDRHRLRQMKLEINA